MRLNAAISSLSPLQVNVPSFLLLMGVIPVLCLVHCINVVSALQQQFTVNPKNIEKQKIIDALECAVTAFKYRSDARVA